MKWKMKREEFFTNGLEAYEATLDLSNEEIAQQELEAIRVHLDLREQCKKIQDRVNMLAYTMYSSIPGTSATNHIDTTEIQKLQAESIRLSDRLNRVRDHAACLQYVLKKRSEEIRQANEHSLFLED